MNDANDANDANERNSSTLEQVTGLSKTHLVNDEGVEADVRRQ